MTKKTAATNDDLKGIHGYQVSGGAAIRTEKRTTSTFAEDVTFSECALPVRGLFSGGNESVLIALLCICAS